MKWTMHELGLIPPLTWPEWAIMATVFGILILAGWAVIQFFRILLDDEGGIK